MSNIVGKGLIYLFLAFVVVVLVGGLSALSGLIFWLLWNAVVPSAFGGPTLSFWSAWALSALIGFIGGCFRRSTQSTPPSRYR